jgi:hypothetical protein
MTSSVQLNNSNFSSAAVPNIWQIGRHKIELLNGDEIAITIQRHKIVFEISTVRFVDHSRWTNLGSYCTHTGKCLQEILNGVKDIGFCGDGSTRTVILFQQPYDWDEIG